MKVAFIMSIFLTALLQNPQTQRPLVLEGGTIIDVSNFGNSESDKMPERDIWLGVGQMPLVRYLGFLSILN